MGGWVLARRNEVGVGGGVPLTTHLVKAAKRRLGDFVLRAVVGGRGAAENVACPPQLIGVGVCGARHLPGSDTGRVRLPRRCVAELGNVGLRLEHEDRDRQIGADPDIIGHALRPQEVPIQRSSRTKPAVDEDAVEGVRPWLDGIGERRQVGGRLRLADGDEVLGLQASERRLVRGSERPPDLVEHVQCVLIAGMVERAVPCRLGRDEATAAGAGSRRNTDERLPAVDGKALRRHTDPGVPGALQEGIQVLPIGGGLTRSHVHPFDDDGPVEPRRIRRPAHQDPRLVGGRRGRGDRPVPVAREGRGGERDGRSRREELLFDVAGGFEIEWLGRERLNHMPRRDRTGQRRRGAIRPLDLGRTRHRHSAGSFLAGRGEPEQGNEHRSRRQGSCRPGHEAVAWCVPPHAVSPVTLGAADRDRTGINSLEG